MAPFRLPRLADRVVRIHLIAFISAIFAAAVHAMPPPRTHIMPGEIWPDDRGRHIQAHGGSILKQGDTYYWFGEDRGADNTPGWRFVACYSSKDLLNWEFRRQVFKSAAPENLGPRWILEDPKVYYNAKNGKHVMYMRINGTRYAPCEGTA